MKRFSLLATLLFAAAALPAAAQSLKPGLWEITSRMQSGSGEMEQKMAQMQQQLASMPPDQRKMMEEAMAQRGMKMGGGGPGGMTLQMCMTREMVERNEIPSQKGDCKTTQQSRSGNTMKMAFACTNPPSSGEGTMTFTSPEAYSTKMTVNTTVQGKPEKMNMESSGKWLAADCGSVKPPAMPKK
ncbi:DUF3617 domain-containing protein [Caenimonas aquaedulcis]|uniref:DUF3617 domain-containing protein n=1 Tax=Caenimonas aquaedulcis TaxID=2793270 RepID=A0A931H4S7_9BURK|nr:DUF3617 domain-containing protein [Caenimonas aquaedulcis]MBG9388571.1 DUF3617 domain-containing protein [Caenimonas aquaedulcis]